MQVLLYYIRQTKDKHTGMAKNIAVFMKRRMDDFRSQWSHGLRRRFAAA